MSVHDGRVDVTDNQEQGQFEISLDGQRVGFAQYRHRPGRLVLTHTEITPERRGRGLAATLTRHALDAARAEGKQVTPVCPYVDSYIRNHPEYGDLVGRPRPDFDASPSPAGQQS